MGSLVFPPRWAEDPLPPPSTMIFNDEFIFTNIKNNESIDFHLNLNERPAPSTDLGNLVDVRYTSQDVCNREEFKLFYSRVFGKSIKMTFEGVDYFGYLHSVVHKEYEIEFVFSHTDYYDSPEETFIGPLTL